MSTNINTEKYNNLPALYSNAGKVVNAEFSIKVDYTEISTDSNKFTFVGTTLKRASGNWQATGLVVGDVITITFASQISPSGLKTFTRTITYINGDLIYIDSALPAPWTNLIFPTSGQVGGMILKAIKSPQAVEFQFNLTKNGVQSNDSLIDGEINRFVYNGAHLLAVNGTGSFTQLGNKSGGIFGSALPVITRLADTTASIFSYKNFKVTFQFIDWTIYNENDIYTAGNCVAPYITVKTYPLIGNPNGVQKDTNGAKEANTGYFNENYNGGQNPYTIITPISWTDLSNNPIDKMNYLGASKFSVGLTDPFSPNSATRYRIGLAFRPKNDDLYKNKLSSMGNNIMLITPLYDFAPSLSPSPLVFQGATNDEGVSFQLTDLMFAQTSGAVGIFGKVTPNANAEAFFNDLSDGEREMLLWVEIKNPATSGQTTSNEVNVLIYENDCYPAPTIADQIPDVISEILLDHNGNDVNYSGLGIQETVTQDDCVYEIDILLENGKVYDGVRSAISARSIAPADSFELESIFLSFANVPFINGIYEVNQITSRNFNLPASANRNSISVTRNTAEDTATKYGITIRYSFLNDWRYWLAQPNADNYFFDQNFPNNNKNKDWKHYQQEPYNLYVDTYLRVAGVDFYNHFKYFDASYQNGNATATRTLTNSSGSVISNLMDNEIINLQVDFEWLDSNFTSGTEWVEFTIEDFEAGSRYVSSSVFERGAVAGNPFINNLIPITVLTTQKRRATAQINTALINANKVSLSYRIYSTGVYRENGSAIYLNYRKKEDFNVVKLPSGLQPEDRGLIECCCAYDVYADLTSNDSWKNDVKGVYLKRSTSGDTATFKIKDCNNNILTNYGTVLSFPNDPLTKGFVYNWKQYLQTYGAGVYTISVDYTISGITGTLVFGAFNLQQYSLAKLNETVRLKSLFNSYSMEEDIDFTGSNFVDTVRSAGYFGLMQPNVEVNNLIDKGRKMVKTTREYLKSYELTCEPLTSCESPLILKHLLNEDGCFISDYNISNHSYLYNDFPVIVSGEINCEYPSNARLMRLKATFNDITKNKKSMYNVI
jgi:hypothetical protein